MPRKSDVIKSKYFRAADYPADWTLTAEIELARIEKVGQDGNAKEKLVVYFRRQQQGLVCGAVLWDQFIEATGEENSDDWHGHMVELFRTETQMRGDTVACIRVRKPDTPAKKAKAAPKPEPKPEFNDEVEF